MDDSLISQYLRTRVLANHAGKNQLVNTIRRTMELLSDEADRHSEQPQDKYIDELCTVAVVQKGGYAVLIDLRTECGPAEHQPLEDTQHLLTAAAYTGKIEVLRALLEKNADVNTGSRYFGKPLQAAAYAGHNDVVLLLLEQGADVDDGGAAGWYTLDQALDSQYYGTALQAASLAGHEHIARLLVKSEYNAKNSGKDYPHAIMMAAQGGHPGLVQFLMENGRITQPSRLRKLLLRRACHYGQEQVVRMMLDSGANVNVHDGMTGTPLHIAAHHGYEKVVRLLLARGANQHHRHRHHPYNGPIHEAAKTGHERVAQILLDHGADINGGWPAPLAAAAFNGKAHMVRFLLDRGADVTAPNCGDIALSEAASQGYESVVRLLGESGVNVEGSH